MLQLTRFTFIVIVLAVLELTFTSSARADQLLLNGGFESGSLAPWFQANDYSPGTEDWNVTSADAHTGIYSATDMGNKELRLNLTATSTGRISQISFWVRHPDVSPFPDGLPAAVDFFYEDGTQEESTVLTTTTNWEFFEVTKRLANGKQLVGFSLFGFSTAGRYGLSDRTFIDDLKITVKPVPEPATMLLLGTGLAGLGGMIKRRRQGKG